MNRSIFQITIFLITVFFNFNTILCTPKEFMSIDFSNNIPYFFYGDVKKILFYSDLDIFKNNFYQTSFDLVRYLQPNGFLFNKNDPKTHYNLLLNLEDQCLNYYYSFPFSHFQPNIYYDYLSPKDLNSNNSNQYWRPYIGVHDKNLVKINKFNINSLNLNNYILDNDLRFKIYKILKIYKNK